MRCTVLSLCAGDEVAWSEYVTARIKDELLEFRALLNRRILRQDLCHHGRQFDIADAHAIRAEKVNEKEASLKTEYSQLRKDMIDPEKGARLTEAEAAAVTAALDKR
jgi:hypothetical protein